MITKEKKTNVINANATHENDTGSPEVQVAIWTERIRELSVSAAACSTTSPRRTSSAIVPSSQS